jgi:hypothetical protein
MRIIAHWSLRYVMQGAEQLNPGLVDEAWAIYMGAPVDGAYPSSLSAAALGRERNFERPGSLDAPLRAALARAQQAAGNRDAAAYEAAARQVYSRFNAIYYLGTARYLNEPIRVMASGDAETAAAEHAEGLAIYRMIQPTVARVDPQADATLMEFFSTPPAALTTELRDAGLEALNRAFDALLLETTDLVTAALWS